MGGKSVALLVLLIVSPIIVYLLWPSDEARIRKFIKEGAEAVEREDIEGVMSHVSFNYQDENGLGYAVLKDAFGRQFDAYSDIGVEYENLSIEVDGGRARASMDVRVLASEGERRGYIFGDLKEPARLILELEKSPARKWLVIKASMSGLPAGPA